MVKFAQWYEVIPAHKTVGVFRKGRVKYRWSMTDPVRAFELLTFRLHWFISGERYRRHREEETNLTMQPHNIHRWICKKQNHRRERRRGRHRAGFLLRKRESRPPHMTPSIFASDTDALLQEEARFQFVEYCLTKCNQVKNCVWFKQSIFLSTGRWRLTI